jgi:hypothetical protein
LMVFSLKLSLSEEADSEETDSDEADSVMGIVKHAGNGRITVPP